LARGGAAPEQRAYAVKELWLFASVAREELNANSDIDTLVEFTTPVTPSSSPAYGGVWSRCSIVLSTCHRPFVQARMMRASRQRRAAARRLAYAAALVLFAPGDAERSRRAIQELARQADLTMTQRYMHFTPVALDAVIRLLEQLSGPSAWQRYLQRFGGVVKTSR
jgi:hypothetical protein